MNDEKKTKAQLIEELHNLRTQYARAQQTSLQEDYRTPLYQNIIEHANDAIITINRDGIIITYNRKAEEMFGYSAEEMMGKSSVDLLPLGTRSEEQAIIKKHGLHRPEGLLKAVREGIALCKNGEILPVEASYYGFHLCGEYLMTGIIRDISDRKRNEKELMDSRDFLERIFSTAQEGILVGDAHGYLTMVNDAAARMLRYSQDELIGKHPAALFTPPQEKEQARKTIQEFLTSEKLTGVERSWTRKDGSLIDIEMNMSIIKDPEGNITGAVSSIRDISARKQAEKALRASEERYRRIFENAFVAIQEEDISRLMSALNGLKSAGVRDLRTYLEEHPDFIRQALGMITIIDANEAALKLFGAQHKEELVSSPDKIWREESLPAFREALIAFAGGKAFFQTESIHHTLQGVQKNVLLQLNFLIKQRDLNRVLVSIVDITPLKSVERKLVDYQQQLRLLANQLIKNEEGMRRNLGAYLHDRIGQTLSIIKIRLEMLGTSLTDGNTREKHSDILRLLETAIQDTRNLSYKLSPVVLHELGLEAALGWLAEQTSKEHNIAVTFRSDKKPKQLDENLKVLLYRAVSELLINVVKHAQANNVVVSMRRKDEHLHITIADNGIGFDPAEISRLPAGERGFGLFSIKERLHYFGGDIEIKSAPHKGAHITLRAPLT